MDKLRNPNLVCGVFVALNWIKKKEEIDRITLASEAYVVLLELL